MPPRNEASGVARFRRVALSPLVAGVLWMAGSAHAGASQATRSGASESGPLIDSAYAALEAGDLRRAREWADRARRRAPRDPAALIARGRVYLAWPRVGRFQALELFRRAARRAPGDPEPHYWIGRTGIALLGDDGEAIARRGLERVLALDPMYRDAWDLWARLYRGPKERARLIELLGPHANKLEVQTRIIRLWIESEECEAADRALAELEGERPDPRWPAWRAECAFIRGHEAEGWAHYERALRLADRDSTGALWAQVASIARPDERAAFLAVAAAGRNAFYEAFWGPRDPDVRTTENERIPEHFRRRAEARDRYRLLHPLSLYHYSMEYRHFVSRVSTAERESYVAQQLERGARIAEALSSSAGLTAGERLTATLSREQPASELARLVQLEAGHREPDLTGISPEILPLGRNLLEMIDDRGLVFIRHGPPEGKNYWTLDAEEWSYESQPPLWLRFARGYYPPDPPLPDMIYRPMTASQAQSISVAMTSDRTSVPAPLEFGFWFARFRATDDPARTDVVIVPEASVSATAVLWDGVGLELARGSARAGSAIQLTSLPGRLRLAVDAERSDSLGRYRGVIELPDFGSGGLAVSDILLAHPVGGEPPGRSDAAASAVSSLTLSTREPFVVYLEIYGLAAEGGMHQVELTYEFEQARGWLARLLRGENGSALKFERVVPVQGDGRMIEALRLSSRQIPPANYAVSVRVRDLVTGEERQSRPVSIRLLP